jgi:hypothetical protein
VNFGRFSNLFYTNPFIADHVIVDNYINYDVGYYYLSFPNLLFFNGGSFSVNGNILDFSINWRCPIDGNEYLNERQVALPGGKINFNGLITFLFPCHNEQITLNFALYVDETYQTMCISVPEFPIPDNWWIVDDT